MIIDDNALFRHPEYEQRSAERTEDTPLEAEARKQKLAYVDLSGDIGIVGNGAGLVMATLDLVHYFGGEPANFLDVGGGANAETVENGFKIILADKNVKAVLINIFGGIVRCDRVATGVVEAAKKVNVSVPIVVRLAGTNAEEAKAIIENSGLAVVSATSFKDAVCHPS
jgi:succinyl-CoA synthetase beta subunit